MQPELASRASGPLLIAILGVMLIVLSLISMWTENRQGKPLNGIILFALGVVGFCVFALLAGYV